MFRRIGGSARAAFVALIAALVVAAASWQSVPLVKRIDLAVFDAFQRAAPRPYDPETPVRVVAIDRSALEMFGQWPWPRPVLAELVTRLRDRGAAAIGFDIVFAEPDRTSPEEIARALAAATGKAADAASDTASHDSIFAAAIADAPVVLAVIPNTAATGSTPALKASASWLGPDATPALYAFPGADVNRPELSAPASGIGSIALTPEDRSDGIIRRIPLLVRVAEREIPAFSMEILRVAQGARGYLVRGLSVDGEAPRVTDIRVGAVPVETTADGGIWLRYAGAQPARTLSVARFFDDTDTEAADEIAGRLILIGPVVEGLRDIVATPLSSNVPGVEVHAELLEQVLGGDALSRPDYMAGAERLAAIGIGILIALAYLLAGFPGGTVVALILGVAAPVVSFFAFRDQGLLVGSTIPAAAALFAWSGGGLTDYFGARRERREIKRQFEHFVAPDVIAEIAQDPEKHMTPGGEERDLTILFSDVRSFSTISAGLTPQELIDWLNSYLTPMAEAILDEKGTIDKFIGDAIMAFWNAPRRDPNHARQALRGALAMATAMDALNDRFKGQGRPLAAFGIGLNTGPCSVGRIGARKRLDYTCIGDAVNVASRIEGLTKMYRATILVGEDCARQAGDFALVGLDRVEVKGREGVPLEIFALLGDESRAATPEFTETRAHWDDALTAYRARRFDEAETLFTAMQDGPLSGPASVFAERSATFRSTPPPSDWDAVFRAESK